jgi:hypothetical protein
MLLTFGVGLNPVASFFPVKLLINLLNYSIAGDVGNRLVAALAMEIDKRMKLALTGDSGYQLGDFSKRALLRFTGKPEYEFGDITRAVVDRLEKPGFDSEAPKVLFGVLEAPKSTESVSVESELDQSLLTDLQQLDVIYEESCITEEGPEQQTWL